MMGLCLGIVALALLLRMRDWGGCLSDIIILSAFALILAFVMVRILSLSGC